MTGYGKCRESFNNTSENKEEECSFYRLLDYVKTCKGEICLLLGNGASIGSGGKRWDEIADEIAGNWKLDIPTNYSINEKYDLIFKNAGDYYKQAILEKHLSNIPLGNGYKGLANLIKEGYFNVIFTTNFDHLINKSLNKVGWVQDKDFTIQIPRKISLEDDREAIESESNKILSILNNEKIKAKIVKLHGDLTYPNTLILTEDDIKMQTPLVIKVLGGYLKRNQQKGILLIGYSGRDIDIATALNKAEGNELVWWLNPNSPSMQDPITGFLSKRKVFPHNAILENDGKFDKVFEKLHKVLIKSDVSEMDTILKKIVGERRCRGKDIDALKTFLDNHSIVIPSSVTLIKNLSVDAISDTRCCK